MIIAIIALGTACNSQKQSTATPQDQSTNARPEKASERQGNRPRGLPSTEKIFELDANQDGKLSKTEVKGPLLNDFEKIDTNGDGFISKEELEKAPKPQRGQRPPKNN